MQTLTSLTCVKKILRSATLVVSTALVVQPLQAAPKASSSLSAPPSPSSSPSSSPKSSSSSVMVTTIEAEGKSQQVPCDTIHNSTFVSGPKEGGLGPLGETQAPWELRFSRGEVFWSHGDVIEKGFYECLSNELIVIIAGHRQVLSFSDYSVIYQDENYEKPFKKHP